MPSYLAERPPLLPYLAEIIQGWERAEAITIIHAWVTDCGDWRVEWIEKTCKNIGILGGGENHIKVSRLIQDLKGTLTAHSIAVTYIARPGPASLRVWTAAGQYLRWDAPDGMINMGRPTEQEVQAIARATPLEAT